MDRVKTAEIFEQDSPFFICYTARMKNRIFWVVALCAAVLGALTPEEARTARLHDAKWGVFNHFLGYGCKTADEWNRKVEAFDVEKLADQLDACGARFYFFTLMQGGKFMCAPNATYDRIAGTQPGEACSRRDLPADLAASLEKRGIDLYLYFTGDGPYKDDVIGGRFGFTEPRGKGVTRPFVEKWASVLEEYAVRYGERVKGWWIDGCYKDYFKYTDDLLKPYADAVRKGNPDALVAMNNGVKPYYEKYYSKEDFVCGEFNDFFVIPRTRFINGAQAFLLAPLGVSRNGTEWGGWGQVGCKHDAAYMADFVSLVNRAGGVVAIDVKVHDNGSFEPDQLEVLKAVGARADLEPRTVCLSDFSRPYGGLTLGGEFPGAKATLTREAEGEASFMRLAFDLTKGNYVGYTINEALPKGTSRISFTVRLSQGLKQPRLFLRLHDSEGQAHAQHLPFAATGTWTVVSFDMNARSAHWGGADDGVLRWPVRQTVLGIELGGTNRVGALDVRDVRVETICSPRELPSATITCTASKFGALYQPDESPSFTLSVKRRVSRGVPTPRLACRVSDGLDNFVMSRLLEPGQTSFTVTPAELGNRFGAFKLTVQCGRDARMETWFARLTGPAPKPCFWVGTGTHGGHGWGHGDLRYLDILSEAGIGMVRDDFGWAECEDGKDGFKMPPRFRAYAEALHARGIALNCIFNGKSKVHANPFDPQAAAKWCAWAVKEFGDTVNDYELWNEPHNFGFRQHYQKDPKDNDGWMRKFVECSRACRDAIVAARPQANVLLTAEDVASFFNRMIELGIARDNDVLSFHPYCHAQIRPEREMFFNDDGASIRRLAAAHGGAHRFRITEAGWTTVMSTNMTHAFVGCYPRSTYHDQARYMIRMYLLARALGVESAMQYDFRNDGPDRYYTENNFGLVHEDYTPKPSLAAIAFMTRLVGHAEPKGALSNDRERYRIYRFVDGARDVLAAWSVEGDATVDLPKGWEKATAFDLQGNAMPLPLKDGRLQLTETPVYLVK